MTANVCEGLITASAFTMLVCKVFFAFLGFVLQVDFTFLQPLLLSRIEPIKPLPRDTCVPNMVILLLLHLIYATNIDIAILILINDSLPAVRFYS
jgi:hypothetical protein